MRLTRCHVQCALHEGSVATLPDDVAAHLLRVLRLQIGDRCVLFNGDGYDYSARITKIGKHSAEVEIESGRLLENESPLHITLLQGIARGEKMDWILQKSTELGVTRFLPVFSERSEVKLDAQRAEKRLAHWREVVISACEQSGRARVPEVVAPQPLANAAARIDGLGFVLDPEATLSLQRAQLATTSGCTLAIGPEGGWSERDLDKLHAAGFTGLRLGPRILRTETAGIAAISALQMLHGDLG
ncbi:MAG: 16S rRNA (uracil(1498)-N(3))-methyltransferase [Thermomonas sp.]|jgi:16S rRNA (uracil1498-N3)-methyltransferase|uniref:16S rRNA (uracil(1498)-N(3))-methyltransferase n=1 Tax=Thermomonas sp. TaxID=1971895 RepID=UPI001EB747AD|nr:16S rRNA (uracil(1498)-N(3))-methyltransferase [Thermomonas sp.]MBV2208836.1 16S rRNA (uracil(1498)-N(3))-methyltransferase [Thermomonas sp.]